LNVKPAVGFTLPSAGVTPAPSERKSRNVEDDLSLSIVERSEESRIALCADPAVIVIFWGNFVAPLFFDLCLPG
jgi:hypothetical protein